MKKQIFFKAIISILFIFLFSAGNKVESNAEDLIDNYACQTMPDIYRSDKYQVSADNHQLTVIDAGDNAWRQQIACCSFSSSDSVTLHVTTNFSFSFVRVLPRNANIVPIISGNTITFSVAKTGNYSLVFDENFQGSTLHIFAQSPETDVPEPDGDNVLYYGPGYYDYSNAAPISLTNGQTLYIAAGAIVRARVRCIEAHDVTIAGRGILLNDYSTSDNYDNVALAIKESSNVHLHGITILRDVASWSAFMWKCNSIDADNIKIINPRYACSDGFDIANSHNVTFNHMFIRSSDDSIAIKGTGTNGYNVEENPANADSNYTINIINSQVWNDANNALGIGAETAAASFRDIHFKNIDILNHYDDFNYPDQFTDRAALNICVLNSTFFSDISYEDIRVEHAKRLISIIMPDDFWFGSLPGNWNWSGNITNILYKDIISYSNGSNEVQLCGKNASHNISGITFNNVVVNGNPLRKNSSLLKVNSYVDNITFINGGSSTAFNGPFGTNVHNAAAEYSQNCQGEHQWYYKTWTAGIGNRDMLWDTDGSCHWRGYNSYDAIWTYGNTLYLHPDNDQTMLEWKADKTGTISVKGNVRKYDIRGGDGVNVSIWKNDQLIWPKSGWAGINYNDNIGLNHNFELQIERNDVISFRVDEGNNNGYDSSIWDANVIYEFYRSY